MRPLYEIEREFEECWDSETGEILDAERLDALQMERVAKLEGVACSIKNLKAFVEAIKREKEELTKRQRTAEKRIEGLSGWLLGALRGEKLTTAKVAVSVRRSEALDIINETDLFDWACMNGREDLIKIVTPTISVSAVKQAIKDGDDIPYARIEERMNIQIR